MVSPCDPVKVSLASSRRRGKDVWLKWALFHVPVSECCRTNQIARLQ